MDKLENSKNQSNWGGAREGSGRPKGSENQSTKEKKEVEKEMKERILKSVDSLLNAQMSLAQGVQMLYRIEKDEDGKQKKPELVTSQAEIEDYLAGEYDDGLDYYFITTQRPDNRALDSLFDRVFGKAPQKTELTGKNGGPIETKELSSEEYDAIKQALLKSVQDTGSQE